MGTRSLTFVFDEQNNKIMCLYRHFDGYPTGHGADLSNFLNSFDAIVYGISFEEKRKVANGMGCLAAQMVAHFKQSVGAFYLIDPNTIDAGQDYEYHVFENKIKVLEFENCIFEGTWKEFSEFTQETTVTEE